MVGREQGAVGAGIGVVVCCGGIVEGRGGGVQRHGGHVAGDVVNGGGERETGTVGWRTWCWAGIHELVACVGTEKEVVGG